MTAALRLDRRGLLKAAGALVVDRGAQLVERLVKPVQGLVDLLGRFGGMEAVGPTDRSRPADLPRMGVNG